MFTYIISSLKYREYKLKLHKFWGDKIYLIGKFIKEKDETADWTSETSPVEWLWFLSLKSLIFLV